MRWDRFFDDLEDQLASEWEAERAALDSETERLRLSRVPLRDRLTVLAEDGQAAVPSFELRDGTVLRARVSGVGADWAALEPAEGRPGALIVPLSAVVSIGMPHPELLRSARAVPPSALRERMTLGFALRDLMRRRVGVTLHLAGGRSVAGTIDRAGADHLDLAVHEPGAPRRAEEVTGYRLVPFEAILCVRLDGGARPL